MSKLSHIDDKGQARMVDVSEKAVTARRAVAEGFISMRPETLVLVESGQSKKGDVIAAARIAGIMAAKRTHELIPLCHPLAITKATVDFALSQVPPGVHVKAEVKVSGQTGVEMEALTAVSIACLTLYDMLKAVDKSMIVDGIRLVERKAENPGSSKPVHAREAGDTMALLPVAEALQRIFDSAALLNSEDVELRHAFGRTLATSVAARVDNPPFDASAMDGYAVSSMDGATTPASFVVIGESGAGKPFEGRLGKGQAARIFTGGSMPDGADTVVIQEDVLANGTTVTIRDVAVRGANVRARGQDFIKGEILLQQGRRLTARDVLLAASAGHATLPVIRKPVVAILSTGDELVEPGTPLQHGQIWASNSFGLAAMVDAAGGDARVLGIARDSHESLAAALNGADGADVLVTIGGASVGDHDLVRPALERAGARLDFYKIAMRPGKPLFFGSRVVAGVRQHCLGLPGNPVSAVISARVFLVPLIGWLLGREAPLEAIDAVLTEPIEANGPRQHYMRAELDITHSPPRVTPFKSQDSGLITALQRADCLLVVAADAPRQPAGSVVNVLKLDI